MIDNVYQELKFRGFIVQATNEDELESLLAAEKVTCYIGFDPTADSLHAGSLVPLMALHHMQRYGHRPIAILGGGTTMIGDPSGKTEMRQMLQREQIRANGEKIKAQIGKFIDLDAEKGLVLDNADWLLELNYVDFLREVGRHFSVNRMLAAEAYRIRLETGLTFLEFNYQLLQAYDFLVLYRKYGCTLQMGGNDQWGNILAGTELIRRTEGSTAYAMTFPLLTTASGQKMGKTAAGAVWLDPEKTSPYEFYQYWVNVDDKDVVRFLNYLTVLPEEEIAATRRLTGAALQEAKHKLAFEVTAFVHGKAAAEQAEQTAKSIFSGRADEVARGAPETRLARHEVEDGLSITTVLTKTGLAKSQGEARRLIRGGGLYLNGSRVEDELLTVDADDFADGRLLLRAGKKRYHFVRLAE